MYTIFFMFNSEVNCHLGMQIFGSDPSCACYLKNLIETLFNCTTCRLTNIKVPQRCITFCWFDLLIAHSTCSIQSFFGFILQDFTARPDIADDCFLLASRCIRYCPQLFIPSAVFPSLVDCSMIGVTVQHRYKSVFL